MPLQHAAGSTDEGLQLGTGYDMVCREEESKISLDLLQLVDGCDVERV